MTLIDQLLRDEGFKSKPYKDTKGFLTIGVGRNLDAEGISLEEAKFLLSNDIESHSAALFAAAPWVKSLDDARQGVLLNMAFNMGVPGLMEFKNTLAHVRNGDYSLAAQDMLKSVWANQVGSRATRLAIQMNSGEWQ